MIVEIVLILFSFTLVFDNGDVYTGIGFATLSAWSYMQSPRTFVIPIQITRMSIPAPRLCYRGSPTLGFHCHG